tara:strand:- start:616 stop:795 length:180 start_codon:yes stop_codon:yes gene_type:complete
MIKQIVGINENFSKRDQEYVSELIWETVQEQDAFKDSKGITGISYTITVDVQEEEEDHA